MLEHLDAELLRAAQHLERDAARIGDAVAPAARRTEHVVEGKTRHDRGVDPLDRHAERVLQRATLLELGQAGLRRREKEIADLAEELWAERGQELDALPREHDLLGRRELLADTAHRSRGRAVGERAALGNDDVVCSEQRELVRDARADRARACDDYASHSRTIRSTSVTSSSCRPRSGGRTPPRMGTPRSASTTFEAAWNGSACSEARRAPTRAPFSALGSRTSATTASGKLAASPETAPVAPPARPCGISASGPTKMSSPSSRYGSKRSHGVSETFRPTKFDASSRSSAMTVERHRVAASRRELVDVERQRIARLRSRAEVREQLVGVEREVRRRDHRDGVRPGLRRVLGEEDGVAGGLRAAVDGDLELSAAGEEELGHALALVDVEEHALARRPEREQAVDSVLSRGRRRTARRRPRRARRHRRRAASVQRRWFRAASADCIAPPVGCCSCFAVVSLAATGAHRLRAPARRCGPREVVIACGDGNFYATHLALESTGVPAAR